MIQTAKIYGIPNCDTVKKARSWLEENEVHYQFHDFKKNGITKEKLEEWIQNSGWQNLLNKRGTTWKTLSANDQVMVNNEKSAIAVMIQKPSVIKRPVIETQGRLLIGFDAEEYKNAFKKQR